VSSLASPPIHALAATGASCEKLWRLLILFARARQIRAKEPPMPKLVIATIWLGLATVALSTGCSGGLSSEDASAKCDELRTAHPGCMSQTALDQCAICFEDCGDACAVADTACPLTFSCPD